MADGAGRGRTRAGVVESRPGHPERETCLLDRDALNGQFGHQGEPDFWGHHLLDRRRGLPQDLDFVLQFGDPRPGLGQGSRLHRCGTQGLQAPIDQVLALPSVQAGLGDGQ